MPHAVEPSLDNPANSSPDSSVDSPVTRSRAREGLRGRSRDDWYVTTSQEVLDYTREQIEQHGASPQQRQLMLKALETSSIGTAREGYCGAIHLPLLVYAGVHGSDKPAVPLAAVCVLLWLGAELYDNLTDGDLQEEWSGHEDFEIIFTATALGCVLPAAIVAGLDTTPERIQGMQDLLSKTLLRMFAGQTADLFQRDAVQVTAEQVELSVIAKNGEAKALFCGISAYFAGASLGQARAYVQYGRSLGAVYQLQSDSFEMFGDADCRDLVQGVRTLQVVMCLEQLSPDERVDFVELLDQAKESEAAREQVRQQLRLVRFLRPWAQVVLRHVNAGQEALSAAAPLEPSRRILHDILDGRTPRCV